MLRELFAKPHLPPHEDFFLEYMQHDISISQRSFTAVDSHLHLD